jgi:hypothetical protein
MRRAISGSALHIENSIFGLLNRSTALYPATLVNSMISGTAPLLKAGSICRGQRVVSGSVPYVHTKTSEARPSIGMS